MSEYEFVLKFRLPNAELGDDALINALAEAGCDDATVGLGQPGRIALDFTREAKTAEAAIVSAMRAVQKAIPGAELVEAAPDFVGLTDIADLVGCSRQNMRKLVVGNASTFPLAVHEGTQSLWRLRPVLSWFADTQQRAVNRSLLEVAEVTMKLNIAKEMRRIPGAKFPKAVEALFA